MFKLHYLFIYKYTLQSHIKWNSRGDKLIVEVCGPPSDVEEVLSQIETADRETSVVVLYINSPTVYFDVRKALHEHGLAWVSHASNQIYMSIVVNI